MNVSGYGGGGAAGATSIEALKLAQNNMKQMGEAQVELIKSVPTPQPPREKVGSIVDVYA